MPEYVVDRITNMMNNRFASALKNSNILVLGVAYKKNIKDMRESPALDVIKLLEDRGAKVIYNDPYVPEFDLKNFKHKSQALNAALLKKADLTVILTDHTQYDYDFVVEHSTAVFDSRNATKNVRKNRQKIELL